MTNRMGVRESVVLGLAITMLAFGSRQVAAQSPVMPLSKAVVSDDVAKRTLMKMQINAATARALVDACVEFARGSNASYSIFVLAPTGDVVDAHIMDGQFPIAVEAAELKAKTVLYARSSSRAVTQRFSTTEGRLPRLRLGQPGGAGVLFRSRRSTHRRRGPIDRRDRRRWWCAGGAVCVSRSNEGARSSTSATPCRTGDGRPAGQRRARRAGSQRVIVFLVAFCS